MASASPTVGIRITVGIPGLEEIRNAFLSLPNNLAAKHMAAGLRRAAEKGGTLQALKNNTPRGPTGNLRRSIAIKSKRYPRTGVGLVILGFKSGRKMNEPYDNTKLGYHQGLVEFGTKQRFRKTKDGREVSTGKMPVGGSFGRPPVRTAWEQTRKQVESLMVKEMEEAFGKAARELADQIKSLQGPF
jgi:HK97 gp10 family phage protein